jgi:large subunit ribosomal protein L13
LAPVLSCRLTTIDPELPGLMGKHKTIYTPFLDTGDHVIVINAAKVKLTGRKDTQKIYRHFTGYPGGLVETGAQKVRATVPPG